MTNTAKQLQKKIAHLTVARGDRRYLDTMGFLVSKRLLVTNDNNCIPKSNVKLRLTDVLWAATIEPRIMEVLPAAILRFKANFDYVRGEFPDLDNVIENIKKGNDTGPDLRGLIYADIKKWADKELMDKRTKPQKDKKIPQAFRLSPNIIKKLEREAVALGKTKTEIIEILIENMG